MGAKEELQELYEFKNMIQMKVFQKFIMEPLMKELNNLKYSYECKTLQEMQTLKGKQTGLSWLIKRLKQIENDTRNKKNEVDSTDS